MRFGEILCIILNICYGMIDIILTAEIKYSFDI